MEYPLAMINYENELNKLFSGEPHEYVTADKFNIVLSEGFPESDLDFFKNCKCDGINDYIWFVSPFEPSWNDMVDEIKASYLFVKEGFEHDIIMQNHYIPECNEGYPFEFYPGEKCILPWAQCDNGTVFYWRIENGKWSILVYGESDTFYEYDMTIYEILYKLVNGEIDDMSQYLPDNLFENGMICCYFSS